MSERYKAVKASAYEHCGFGATVLDTAKRFKESGPEHFQFDSVCECFEFSDAETVAKALNLLHLESAT